LSSRSNLAKKTAVFDWRAKKSFSLNQIFKIVSGIQQVR